MSEKPATVCHDGIHVGDGERCVCGSYKTPPPERLSEAFKRISDSIPEEEWDKYPPPERGRMSDEEFAKKCSACGDWFPRESGFYRDKRAPDGKRTECKGCNAKAGFERRRRTKDAIRKYNRAYQQRIPIEKKRERFRREQKARQPKRTEAQKKYRAEHPERSRAHHAVRRALSKGTLTRPTVCQKCGRKGGRIEASHWDYTRPLFVEWLCVKCHRTKDGFPGYGGAE